MKGLTLRQRQVLEFIERYIAARGYPPAIREIGQALGVRSSSSIVAHVWALVRKGYITHEPRKPRTIQVIAKAG